MSSDERVQTSRWQRSVTGFWYRLGLATSLNMLEFDHHVQGEFGLHHPFSRWVKLAPTLLLWGFLHCGQIFKSMQLFIISFLVCWIFGSQRELQSHYYELALHLYILYFLTQFPIRYQRWIGTIVNFLSHGDSNNRSSLSFRLVIYSHHDNALVCIAFPVIPTIRIRYFLHFIYSVLDQYLSFSKKYL